MKFKHGIKCSDRAMDQDNSLIMKNIFWKY